MKSTEEHPFAFFDWYFEKEIFSDQKQFYIDIPENVGGRIEKIDKKKHFIEILDINEEGVSEVSKYSFERYIHSKLNREKKLTKSLIESSFKTQFADKINVQGYANFFKIKLRTLKNTQAAKDFKFLNHYFEEFESLIDQYSETPLPIESVSDFVHSFNLFPKLEGEEKLTRIRKFYNLLTKESAMIDCSEETFIKAFTGKEVKKPIRWLVRANDTRHSAKPPLLYLLNVLTDYKYLSPKILNDRYKFIRYIFRDHKGDDFKNLKGASNKSNKVISQDRIDKIISSI